MPINGRPAPQSRLATLSSWPLACDPNLRYGIPDRQEKPSGLFARPHIASSSSNLFHPSPHPSFSRVHAEKSTELHASDVTPCTYFWEITQPAALLLWLMSCPVPHGGPPSPSVACSSWSLRGPALHWLVRPPCSPRRAEPQSQETRKPYVRIIKPHASPMMPSPGVRRRRATGLGDVCARHSQ